MLLLNNRRAFHQNVLLNDSVLTISGEYDDNTSIANCEKHYF